MKELVFLLEEPSAKALLDVLLPRFTPEGVAFRFIVFEGKQDLERQLVRRMRGYLNPQAHFIVVRDQDAGDCREIKRRLVEKCRESGKERFLVRIACRELESWYLADLAAVESGLGLTGLRQRQAGKKYRDPDRLSGPKRELKSLTREAYSEIEGSRAIGPHLDLTNARSRSFVAFLRGIQEITRI